MSKNYFGIKALSNSALSYLDPKSGGSDHKFLAFHAGRFKKKSMGFDLGSMCHAHLLEPQNTVEVSELPSGGIRDIIDYVYKKIFNDHRFGLLTEFNLPEILTMIWAGTNGEEVIIKNSTEPIPKQVADWILEGYKAIEYQARWNDDTKIEKAWTNGKEYLSLLLENSNADPMDDDGEAVFFLGNKTACTTEAIQLANKFKENIAYNEMLYRYLFDDEYVTGGQAVNEHAIIWSMHGITMKAKLDRYIINPKMKTIYHFDLKSSRHHPEIFMGSIFGYSYYRQIGLYDMALRSKLDNPGEWTIQHYLVPLETGGLNEVGLYKIAPQFVVAGKLEAEALAIRAEKLINGELQPAPIFREAEMEKWQEKKWQANYELITTY